MPPADPEARRAYSRRYKQKNRWRYRRRQKAYDAARHANERAERFGVPGTLTPEDVEGALASGFCHWCSGTFDYFDLTVDHVVPVARGGHNTPENIVASCRSCNARKHLGVRPDRWANDWDCCVDCGRTSVAHAAHGRCVTCNWHHNGGRSR